jgi:hypothetical protein
MDEVFFAMAERRMPVAIGNYPVIAGLQACFLQLKERIKEERLKEKEQCPSLR